MFKLFIKRPILSGVISVIIVCLGVLSILTLPITQFPDIVPPSVTVTARYTGASADVMSKTVATPLERAINGVPGMTYMTTVCTNDGMSLTTIYFKVGTDPDVAAVNVQNRVTTVLDELPEEVIRAGVITEKEVNSMLMYLNIMSTDSAHTEKFVYNFADINILRELKRIDGVGLVEIMGSRDYAMRVWLNPNRLAAYNMVPQDVTEAIRNQNIEAAPGKTGISSDKLPQQLQYVLQYTGKFSTAEEYGEIVLKALPDGSLLRLKDVATIEFDSEDYNMTSMTDGRPSASIMIKQRPGSNAREVIQNIKTKMAEIKESSFAPGMDYNISYDVSRFLDASIQSVLKTLLEAFILVFIVVYIFLQDFRSTLIPAIAVPVSLVGTFFFMEMLGFSINMLTLFALVLAIGIVVDNAIVVVEAVHVKMHHEKLSPYKASVHTHPIELMAMTHCPKFLEKDVATNMLWSMIPETKAFCPRGLGMIPYQLPSSVELADATIKELADYDVVMWEKHGIFAVDCDVMAAFDQIDVLNKSALIYIAAKNMGFEPDGMSQEQMKEMSVAFNLPK